MSGKLNKPGNMNRKTGYNPYAFHGLNPEATWQPHDLSVFKVLAMDLLIKTCCLIIVVRFCMWTTYMLPNFTLCKLIPKLQRTHLPFSKLIAAGNNVDSVRATTFSVAKCLILWTNNYRNTSDLQSIFPGLQRCLNFLVFSLCQSKNQSGWWCETQALFSYSVWYVHNHTVCHCYQTPDMHRVLSVYQCGLSICTQIYKRTSNQQKVISVCLVPSSILSWRADILERMKEPCSCEQPMPSSGLPVNSKYSNTLYDWESRLTTTSNTKPIFPK